MLTSKLFGIIAALMQVFIVFDLAYAQTQPTGYFGSETVPPICRETLPLAFTSDNEYLDNLVSEICRLEGYSNQFILQKCDNVSNCLAVPSMKDNTQYILYNNTFLNANGNLSISGNSPDWRVLAILAHEIGHYRHSHFSLAIPLTLHERELQADWYSGKMMYLMGATLAQAQISLYDPKVKTYDTQTHPARSKRLVEVKKGYDWAKSVYGESLKRLSNTEKTEVEQLQLADKYYDEGKYYNAYTIYSKYFDSAFFTPARQAQVGFMLHEGLGTNVNINEAVKWHKRAAENGNARGQNNLGASYIGGVGGLSKNVELGVYYYQLSAAQGFAVAQANLGSIYESGEFSLPKDEKKALELYELSASQGERIGQFKLGRSYYNGVIVGKNIKEALRLYFLSAEQGYADAQYYLAIMIENGEGIDKSYEKAFHWYKRAADKGNIYAQYNVGRYYYYGNYVKVDHIEAFKWFYKSADKGYSNAQWFVGYCYHYGLGVSKDYYKAFEWYKKAADKGLALGERSVGYMYQQGKGVYQSDIKAFNWFMLAAAQGDIYAAFEVGYAYSNGEGVYQDYKESMKWYMVAAAEDHAVAQWNVGVMYERGQGVVANKYESIKWYKLAASNGYDEAQKYLNSIGVDWKN